MTCWLGFDIVAAQGVWRVAQAWRRLTGRSPTLWTVRDLAARYGSTIIETADVNSGETIAAMRRLDIDVVVVMNFDQILRDDFIRSPRRGVINVHPSLLPSLRGPCPVFWALVERHPEVGVTIHVIESIEIDAGPIVAQRVIETDFQQSVGELTSALFLAGAELIKNVTDRLNQGWYPCIRGQTAVDGDYRGFPSRGQMAQAVTRRIRLCRLSHVSSLMRAAADLPFPRSRSSAMVKETGFAWRGKAQTSIGNRR
jgi:methionyl-tRNA formyltransferase